MTYTSTTPFFIAQDREQKGPFPMYQVERMLATGQVQADQLCWTEGMEEWLPLKSVLPAPATEPEPEDFNPYAPPHAVLNDAGNQRANQRYYGGIGRGAYFVYSFLLGLIQNVAATSLDDDSPAVLMLILLFVAGSLTVVYQRLKNVGKNPWMCFLSIIPIANFYIGYLCLVCPEGYADTKTLDPAGKILTWVFGILVAFVLGALVLLATGG